MNDIIRQYILEELVFPGTIDSIEDEDDLLTMGMLSSMQFLRLIRYLEDFYEISIPAEHMVAENFQTLNSISSYVNTRLPN